MLLNTPCRGIVDTNFESKRISITSTLKFQEKKEKVEAKTIAILQTQIPIKKINFWIYLLSLKYTIAISP